MEESLSFWTKLGSRSQSNLYFALLFLDRERRDAFRDVYRFVRAADDVVDRPGEASDKRVALRAWKDELDAIYAGGATHPYAVRLAGAVRRFGLQRSRFDTLLAALDQDIDRTTVTDDAELEDYCERVAASTAALALQILGAGDDACLAYGRDVAVALQLANILRDVAEDAERGVVYLPESRLRAAGVGIDEVLAGHWSPGLTAVAGALAGHARDLVARARARLPEADRRRLLVPEIWADVYLELLDELEQVGFDVFGHKPYLHRRRKLLIALRRRFGWIPLGSSVRAGSPPTPR